MIERAVQLSDEMQQQGLHPEVVTYSVLINACEKGKRAERTSHLFHKRPQQGLQPSVITHSTLISACRKCMMTERGLQPDGITYRALQRTRHLCRSTQPMHRLYAGEMVERQRGPAVL